MLISIYLYNAIYEMTDSVIQKKKDSNDRKIKRRDSDTRYT